MDSTNELAMELASEGASHGTVVLADTQSAGRGRLGRHWYSPPGLNVYMSIILRPQFVPGLAAAPGLVPLLAGLSALEAIREAAGYTASLKWPNDIMAGERKLGGILLEARSRGSRMGHAVLGIGINVNSGEGDFPADLRDSATSLFLETGETLETEAVTRALIRDLSEKLPLLGSKAGTETLLSRYRKACSTLGREVRTLAAGGETAGVAVDIDPLGRLLLKAAGGELKPLSSADISLP